MSDSNLITNNPVLKMYEAQAIVVEKDQEIREKDAEIEQLRQEIKRLRMQIDSNKNQQKLVEKITELEQELFVAKNENLQLIDLQLNGNQTNRQLKTQGMTQIVHQWNYKSLFDFFKGGQNVTQHENKIEKEAEQNTSVLVLGGLNCLNTIYFLDSKAQSWKKLKITLPMGLFGFGAVVLNESIYIFGGTASGYLQQHHNYKLKDDGSWIQLASLNQKRSNISSSSLVCKGKIWAIGGESGDSLKSVERYDISQDKWTYMPEMNYPRCNAAAAVYKDRIFVTGGFNNDTLKSVEMFDPKLQK